MFIKSWLTPPSLLQSPPSPTTLPLLLSTTPQSPALPPGTQPLSSNRYRSYDNHMKRCSRRSNVSYDYNSHQNTNNNNNHHDDDNSNHKFNRINIASFHDWSEKSLEKASVSKLYKEMATLTSLCSLNKSNQNDFSSENNNRRPIVCHKLFLSEGTDLTKGEKDIIAGLCRNRGCVLPHIDVSKKNSNHSHEDSKRVTMKGKKLVSYFPSIHNPSMLLQPMKTNKKDVCMYHWWEQNPNLAADCLRKYNASYAFPFGINYFKDYMSCLFLDMGSHKLYSGQNNSPASSSSFVPPGSSRNLQGIKAPPNTPDLEVTNGNNENAKNNKNNKKEVKLENGKRKTHLVVYLPKAEEENNCDKDRD